MTSKKRLKSFGSVTIRGHVLPVVFSTKLIDAHALVDAPRVKNRKIKILVDVIRDNPLYLFELLSHEALHVAFWDIDEEAIDETGKAMRHLLVKWLKFLVETTSEEELLNLIKNLPDE